MRNVFSKVLSLFLSIAVLSTACCFTLATAENETDAYMLYDDFENKSFLDVFAGSGIMGFEAISRGFGSLTFVEKDKKTYFLLSTDRFREYIITWYIIVRNFCKQTVRSLWIVFQSHCVCIW